MVGYIVSDASEILSTTRVGNSIYQIVKSTNYAEKYNVWLHKMQREIKSE